VVCLLPYGDGNGRLGRVLCAWILTRRLGLDTPPALSVRIAADIGGYLSGLTLYRLGDAEHWIAWFADALARSGQAAQDLVQAAGELRASWETRLAGVRADAAAHRTLALLPANPVLDAATLARELALSERAARAALVTLQTHGVLQRFTPSAPAHGRPRHWYLAGELLALLRT
jgi:Fic family protein